MKELDKCMDIFIKMGNGARFWGKYIDEFIENLSLLNLEKIKSLTETIDSKERHALLCQLFGHIERNFDKFDDDQKRKVLNQLCLLIILENCDLDYRENIRLAESFSKTTKNYTDMKTEEWKKVSHLASHKLKGYLEVYFSA